jgi:hypothetical protein
MRPLAIASVVFFCFGLATLLCLGFFLYPFRFLFFLFDDATPPALVAVVSYQFTTDLPLPSTLESFKFNQKTI